MDIMYFEKVNLPIQVIPLLSLESESKIWPIGYHFFNQEGVEIKIWFKETFEFG